MNDNQMDDDVRLLAALAYDEASVANDSNEMGGIAFAVANRCRAWGGKTVRELKAADPNYAYAWNGSNQRFNKFMKAGTDVVKKDAGMMAALSGANAALANRGVDPSNGALFWDGVDFGVDRYGSDNSAHPKRKDGFRYGDPSHNIFGVEESARKVVVRWKIRNKRTGEVVDGAERGRYDAVWISTAAHGKTIFWKHPEDYLRATAGKAYR